MQLEGVWVSGVLICWLYIMDLKKINCIAWLCNNSADSGSFVRGNFDFFWWGEERFKYHFKRVIYFVFILVLQSFWRGRESWLLCFYCPTDVLLLKMFCGYSSRCYGLICSVWLWYFLVILTYFLPRITPRTVYKTGLYPDSKRKAR